jgi:hypothetical protein
MSEVINSPARERQRRRWLGNRFRSPARPRASAAVLARQQVQVVRLTYRCVARYSWRSRNSAVAPLAAVTLMGAPLRRTARTRPLHERPYRRPASRGPSMLPPGVRLPVVERLRHMVAGIGSRRAVDLAVRPDLAWQRISAGAGAKGHRWYHWALIDLADDDPDHDQHGGFHALLVRRARNGELAFYRVWTPGAVPISELVRVAGRRWAIEESFQAGKSLAGLDEHQVRRWTSWRRWTVLAMLAHAFLAVTAARHQTGRPTDSDPQAIIMTCGEVSHLLAALILTPVRAVTHVLAWSRFRQLSAARARASHYARQAATVT